MPCGGQATPAPSAPPLHCRTVWGRGPEGLFVQSPRQRAIAGAGGGTRPPSPERLPGLIESRCLTITSNFIAFMGRRVLVPAAKILHVPWALAPRPAASSFYFQPFSSILPLRVEGGPAGPRRAPGPLAHRTCSTGGTMLECSLPLLPPAPPTPHPRHI